LNYQIKQAAEAVQKIKGSKFIARVYAVESREAALSIVAKLEAEHRKASHVCWACRVDQEGAARGYSSDAGEPHGSAGPPILAAIEGRELTNVLCVVIRYFGGTKLGIGGLIRAYGGVASEALALAGRKKYEPQLSVIIKCDPDSYSDIMRVLRKYRLSVRPVFTPDSVSIQVTVAPEILTSLSLEIQGIPAASIVTQTN